MRYRHLLMLGGQHGEESEEGKDCEEGEEGEAGQEEVGPTTRRCGRPREIFEGDVAQTGAVAQRKAQCDRE